MHQTLEHNRAAFLAIANAAFDEAARLQHMRCTGADANAMTAQAARAERARRRLERTCSEMTR